MFINVNFCNHRNTHASSRPGEHGSQERCAKQEFLGPMNSWKRGLCITRKSWQEVFPHTNYCNVGTIKLCLDGGIKYGHGRKNTI